MANETVVTGKKYRVLADASKKIWHVISFWTKASDVYNNNNQNLQITVGGITGISSSLTSASSNVAASANAVKQLNDKITKLNSDLSKGGNYDNILKLLIQQNQLGFMINGNNNAGITFDVATDGREYAFDILSAGSFEAQSTTSVSNANKIFIKSGQVAYLSNYGIKNDDIATFSITAKGSGAELRLQQKGKPGVALIPANIKEYSPYEETNWRTVFVLLIIHK